MKFLLDTHALLWWAMDDSRLPGTARSVIASDDNGIFVSAVSGWEIATQVRSGTLTLPEKPDQFMFQVLKRNAFIVLPLTLAHALDEYYLPPLHSDPFDRLLIAQAKSEVMTLITHDTLITQYSVHTFWH